MYQFRPPPPIRIDDHTGAAVGVSYKDQSHDLCKIFLLKLTLSTGGDETSFAKEYPKAQMAQKYPLLPLEERHALSPDDTWSVLSLIYSKDGSFHHGVLIGRYGFSRSVRPGIGSTSFSRSAWFFLPEFKEIFHSQPIPYAPLDN